MSPDLLLPLDLSFVPFPTDVGEWYVCQVLQPPEVLYVEHRLIVQVMAALGKDVVVDPPQRDDVIGSRWSVNWSEDYSEHGKALAQLALRWMITDEAERQPGMVYTLTCASLPVPLAVGFFGGRTFVFVPRQRKEQHR